MAKKSAIDKNLKRQEKVKRYALKREKLKKIIKDKNISEEERFHAQLKLSGLPRSSAAVRLRNRCFVTGRPRGYYRKFNLSRIALRELASSGMLPGVVKASW